MKSLIVAVTFALVLVAVPVFARDLGQWHNQDPHIAAWFKRQMQPDNPQVSCCGEADAYEANDFEMKGDQYFAIVTDTRDDGRHHRACPQVA